MLSMVLDNTGFGQLGCYGGPKAFVRYKDLRIGAAGVELSRHDPDVPDWDSLPAPALRRFIRMMEVVA